MSMNDPLGDLLARIRNAQMRNKSKVYSPNSRLRESVLEVLKAEGYIRGYAVVEREGRSEIEIELKYFEGEPVIRELERISKPGRRVYTSAITIPTIFGASFPRKTPTFSKTFYPTHRLAPHPRCHRIRRQIL